MARTCSNVPATTMKSTPRLRTRQAPATPDQMPPAFQAFAEQLEPQMTLFQLGFRIPDRGPQAVVEGIDMPAPVVAGRNVAGEGRIGNRMVLNLDRHALHCRIVGRSLGHRPGFERVTDLQAEVVMTAAGVVKLHDKNWALPLARGAFSAGFGVLSNCRFFL